MQPGVDLRVRWVCAFRATFSVQESVAWLEAPGCGVQEAQVPHGPGPVFTCLVVISLEPGGKQSRFSATLKGAPCRTSAKLFRELGPLLKTHQACFAKYPPRQELPKGLATCNEEKKTLGERMLISL